jgi:hypothetical protein
MKRFDRRLMTIPAVAVLLLVTLMTIPEVASGGSRIVKGVVAEGACAVTGMSPEQSQLVALQRARSAAIEQAAGVGVSSATLVKDGALAVDFIRTYSRGHIVREQVKWDTGMYQESASKPAIFSYKVKITADVALPEKRSKTLGLTAKLNNRVFRKGEKAKISIRTERASRIAVFNVMADDRIIMLLPHPLESGGFTVPGKMTMFPPDDSRVEVVMQPLPGHSRDAEAFFVVALDRADERDFSKLFTVGVPMPFTGFFERYSEITGAEDVILPYIVEGNE